MILKLRYQNSKVVCKHFAVDMIADLNDGCMPTTQGKNVHVSYDSLCEKEQFLKNTKD